MPVTRLVAPGPEVADAHPHLARGPGIAVGGVAGPLLVPDQDVLDVGFVERVVEGDDLPPGYPKTISTPSRLSASRITRAAFIVCSACCLFDSRVPRPPVREDGGTVRWTAAGSPAAVRTDRAAHVEDRTGVRPGDHGYIAAQDAR